ncbi:peptide chain release factor family protein [Leptospira kanakyensis]|uniref:Peptide chain release factor-like protein n=1 Tax=Leptospira kanakyensis TaxID=2484968 RepID=A0A6N4Q998_9LEPT|nr:peptide chain release factor-like protein [Leptospira kanakyensis]MCW7467987.1 peptide chain release factor-like protein [Leptospira kanakyensis]MCW7482479.1 peptide chain release factor-like protein [Leptospira kanakyensis]TGK49368.1 peptide chain release factor-like protein [Leptospira kanakyensis]TGK60392.1 peptide chain release factor-like protein [Leptospira kanakyensis]TGK67790.1 peptide chain release factor-like protein [Leptospira kanakyensis]
MPLTFPVSVEKNSSLQRRMEVLGISEKDLSERFIKSGGKGGQNVNKVSTAVHLVHIPTGKQIKCSVYRTQGLNRYKARDLLCLELERNLNQTESDALVQKIRKKKQDKHRKSLKKKLEKEKTEWNEPM